MSKKFDNRFNEFDKIVKEMTSQIKELEDQKKKFIQTYREKQANDLVQSLDKSKTYQLVLDVKVRDIEFSTNSPVIELQILGEQIEIDFRKSEDSGLDILYLDSSNFQRLSALNSAEKGEEKDE